jgi:hypothetical protein
MNTNIVGPVSRKKASQAHEAQPMMMHMKNMEYMEGAILSDRQQVSTSMPSHSA